MQGPGVPKHDGPRVGHRAERPHGSAAGDVANSGSAEFEDESDDGEHADDEPRGR